MMNLNDARIDSENMDLENMDIGSCRLKVFELLREGDRRGEALRHIQDRIQVCNNELAARREQAVDLERQVEHQREKNFIAQDDRHARASAASSAMVVHEEQSKDQLVRDHLEGVLRKVAPDKTDALAYKFDGTSLIVDSQSNVVNEVDTVLVTYNPPGSASYFKLTYRVDENTTVGACRVDACQYWRVSDVEFVLKTQNGSKVLDQLKLKDVFASNEMHMLRLEKKTPKNVILTDGENRAILPKQGRKRNLALANTGNTASKRDPTNPEEYVSAQDRFNESLQELAGLKEFCDLRDVNETWQAKTIKLRDILFFAFLLVFSLFLFFNRTNNHQYLATQAVNATFIYPPQSSGADPRINFPDIGSINDAWSWLEHTVPTVLLNENSEFRAANDLVGFVEIRQRRVVPRDPTECERPHDAFHPSNDEEGASCVDHALSCCVHAYFTAQTEEVDQYMDEIEYAIPRLPITIGRDTTISPGVWTNGITKPANLADEYWLTPNPATGIVQHTYDTGGYAARYFGDSAGIQNTSAVNVSAIANPNDVISPELLIDFTGTPKTVQDTMSQDMKQLHHNNWIDNRARAVSLAFTAYNGNYDWWINANFVIEFEATGIVHTYFNTRAFKPNLGETDVEHVFQILDFIRIGLLVYVLVVVSFFQYRYRTRLEVPAWKHFTSCIFMLDFLIVCFGLAAIIGRFVSLSGVESWRWFWAGSHAYIFVFF